jgi:hypothetical protein
MDRIFVQSTNVTAIGYDEPSQTLEVEFNTGSVYQYYNVPQHLYDALMQASSKGQFINAYIKNAHSFSRVG